MTCTFFHDLFVQRLPVGIWLQATFKEIDEAFAASGKDAADKKAWFARGSWVGWGKLIMAVYRFLVFFFDHSKVFIAEPF